LLVFSWTLVDLFDLHINKRYATINMCDTIENSTTLYFNSVQKGHKRAFLIEKTFYKIVHIYGDLGLLYKKVAFIKKKARSF